MSALAEHMYNEQVHFSSYISEAMAPFKPGNITTYLNEVFDGVPEVTIEVENLPDDPILIPLNHDEILMWPWSVAEYVGQKAAEFIRSIPRAPIGDNIYLGEE